MKPAPTMPGLFDLIMEARFSRGTRVFRQFGGLPDCPDGCHDFVDTLADRYVTSRLLVANTRKWTNVPGDFAPG